MIGINHKQGRIYQEAM